MARSMRLKSRNTLKALMVQDGITFADLAKAAEVHRSFISHLASGRSKSCTAEVATRISNRLGAPVALLFEEVVPIPPYVNPMKQR